MRPRRYHDHLGVKRGGCPVPDGPRGHQELPRWKTGGPPGAFARIRRPTVSRKCWQFLSVGAPSMPAPTGLVAQEWNPWATNGFSQGVGTTRQLCRVRGPAGLRSHTSPVSLSNTASSLYDVYKPCNGPGRLRVRPKCSCGFDPVAPAGQRLPAAPVLLAVREPPERRAPGIPIGPAIAQRAAVSATEGEAPAMHQAC